MWPRSHSIADSDNASINTRSTPVRQKGVASAIAAAMEQCQTRGHQKDGKGHQESKAVSVDEKSLPDPEQAGEEIAEPEPPAGFGSRSHGPPIPATIGRSRAARDCSVGQPHQRR